MVRLFPFLGVSFLLYSFCQDVQELTTLFSSLSHVKLLLNYLDVKVVAFCLPHIFISVFLFQTPNDLISFLFSLTCSRQENLYQYALFVRKLCKQNQVVLPQLAFLFSSIELLQAFFTAPITLDKVLFLYLFILVIEALNQLFFGLEVEASSQGLWWEEMKRKIYPFSYLLRTFRCFLRQIMSRYYI